MKFILFLPGGYLKAQLRDSAPRAAAVFAIPRFFWLNELQEVGTWFIIIQWKPESWNMALGGLVLGSLILYLKGIRIMMFQLSGFYYMLL